MVDPSVHVLVHNVSHDDFLVKLRSSSGSEYIARPRFDYFHPVSTCALNILQRAAESHVELLRDVPDGLVLGVDLSTSTDGKEPTRCQAWGDFNYRAGCPPPEASAPVGDGEAPVGPELVGVCFPLVAVIIPRWLEMVTKAKEHLSPHRVRLVLFLVSGGGVADNTENTSRLIGMFINRTYQGIEVNCVTSEDPDIYRYDANVAFVRRCLVHPIRMIRSALAKLHDDWRDMCHVTTSLAGGVPARVAAITAGLREFSPNTLHMVRLRTFFLEGRLNLEEVEQHIFETTEMKPPLPRPQLWGDVQMLVDYMVYYRDTFYRAVRKGDDELAGFWLRKTMKPVLAIVMIRKSDTDRRFYCACNLEVSMPTGSLCAERNAIGSALADDLQLKRREIAFVAVLSVSPLEKKKRLHPPESPMSSTATATPVAAVGSDLMSPLMAVFGHESPQAMNGEGPLGFSTRSYHAAPRPGRKPEMPVATAGTPTTTCSVDHKEFPRPPVRDVSVTQPDQGNAEITAESVSHAGADVDPATLRLATSPPRRDSLPVTPTLHTANVPHGDVRSTLAAPSAHLHVDVPRREPEESEPPSPLGSETASSLPPSPLRAPNRHHHATPLRQPVLCKQPSCREPLVPPRDPHDKNPLPPCGACMEWLRKVAEVNPDLKIVTFTDEECSGVYLHPVKME